MKKNKYFFFVGAHDLEMITIVIMLMDLGIPFKDARLEWGQAKASVYKELIWQLWAQGYTPVLIELDLDCKLPVGCVVIDHHGEQSHRPSSILQVNTLLGQKPTEWHQLVALNDVGGTWGLIDAGVDPMTIRLIGDNEAAINMDFVSFKLDSIQAAKKAFDLDVNLPIVLNPFSKFRPAKDWLMLGKGVTQIINYHNESGEIEYQGDGFLASKLESHFKNGWSGGQGKGQTGRFDAFFGCYGVSPAELKEVIFN